MLQSCPRDLSFQEVLLINLQECKNADYFLPESVHFTLWLSCQTSKQNKVTSENGKDYEESKNRIM